MSYKEFTEAVRGPDPLASLMLSELEDTGTYLYAGELSASGAWRISRLTLATNVMRYAWGGSDYSTNWTNRASLTYTIAEQD